MSELLQLRQRMKTVKTTQKLTHAMRLIAMSEVTRLRNMSRQYQGYCAALQAYYAFASQIGEKALISNALITPLATGRKAYIIIGPQKGLCGNFLNALLVSILTGHNRSELKNIYIIIVGRKTAELCLHYGITADYRFDTVTTHTIGTLTSSLTELLLTAEPSFESVVVYSGRSKSFFAQIPIKTQLVPMPLPLIDQKQPDEVLCDEDPQSIIQSFLTMSLQQSLTSLLLESLIAEHSARFISMDQSIRNATQLLNDMHLSYNKLRQTRITRELTDLTAGL